MFGAFLSGDLLFVAFGAGCLLVLGACCLLLVGFWFLVVVC